MFANNVTITIPFQFHYIMQHNEKTKLYCDANFVVICVMEIDLKG